MTELQMLKKQNKKWMERLNDQTRLDCQYLCNHIACSGPLCRFEAELAKKEVIGMAFSADAAGQPLRDFLGMPIDDFLQQVLGSLPMSSRRLPTAEILLPWCVVDGLIWLFYTVMWGTAHVFDLIDLFFCLLLPLTYLLMRLYYMPRYFRKPHHGDLNTFAANLPEMLILTAYLILINYTGNIALFSIDTRIPLIFYGVLTPLLWWYCRRETSKLAAQTDWAA